LRPRWSLGGIANTAVVSLVAGGALAAGSASWCIGSLALTFVLLCAQLCVCVAVTPFITFFLHLHSVVTQVLTILSTGLALGAAVANSRTPQDLDSISTLSNASAVVSLLAVGVVAARMMIDLRSFIVALHRIAQRLRRVAPRAASEKVAPCLSGVDNVSATVLSKSDDVLAWDDVIGGLSYDLDGPTVYDGDHCVVDDSAFWDANGNYRPQRAECDQTNACEGSLIGGVFVAPAHYDDSDDHVGVA
jgi:hypothetical protein